MTPAYSVIVIVTIIVVERVAVLVARAIIFCVALPSPESARRGTKQCEGSGMWRNLFFGPEKGARAARSLSLALPPFQARSPPLSLKDRESDEEDGEYERTVESKTERDRGRGRQ